MPELPIPPKPHSLPAKMLLVVDVQRGFISPASAHIVERIARVQDFFQSVLYARFVNPDPSPFRTILRYNKMDRGSVETELSIKKRSGSGELEHTTYSCVTQELLYWLRAQNAIEVCLCGVATEACILKTAVDLFENHFVPWVIEDLCASDKSDHFHKIAIEVVGALIGQDHIIISETLDLPPWPGEPSDR